MPLLCDANTGWQRHEAMRVINGVTMGSNNHAESNSNSYCDVYIEQPCLTYEECLSVRHHCPLPMVLDETIDDIGTSNAFRAMEELHYVKG